MRQRHDTKGGNALSDAEDLLLFQHIQDDEEEMPYDPPPEEEPDLVERFSRMMWEEPDED
jgi:hypothetical protein